MNNPGHIPPGKPGMHILPDGSVSIKPYNLKELAVLYGVSARTFRKWLSPFKDQLGNRIGYFYTISQVKEIFSRLGLPFSVDDNWPGY